ncbi:TPA: thioredoxin fold domain-containing protein [Escherichia coli]
MNAYTIRMEHGCLSAFTGNDHPIFMCFPGKNPRFFLQGNCLMHDSDHHATRMIYKALSVEDAQALLLAIQKHRRQRQNKSAVVALITGALLVITLLWLVISWPATITLTFDEPASAPQPVHTVPVSTAPQPQETEKTPSPQALRAESLKKAAVSGRYTVTLSTGHQRTLYVFSDPLCPYCRKLEPVLDVLAQDYNVEIFPVSVIGSTDSQKLLSPLLCQPAAERLAHWKSLFAADAGMAPGSKTDAPATECEEGLHALNINNRAFNYYQLPGTPQLLADDGREIPLSVLTSDKRLADFLQEKTDGH